MDELYQRFEARYGFTIPAEYRQMQARGWFDVRDQERYVWLHEAEWLSLAEIADYEFEPYHRSGLVPFAFNCAGDLWCWWPEAASGGVVPVVWCLHDADTGDVMAPHFLAFIYRQMLEFCVADSPWDAAERRQQLQEWHDRFAEFLPPPWASTLLWLMEREPLSEREYAAMVQRALAFERLNQRFKWMD
jgi:hypothetical protein